MNIAKEKISVKKAILSLIIADLALMRIDNNNAQVLAFLKNIRVNLSNTLVVNWSNFLYSFARINFLILVALAVLVYLCLSKPLPQFKHNKFTYFLMLFSCLIFSYYLIVGSYFENNSSIVPLLSSKLNVLELFFKLFGTTTVSLILLVRAFEIINKQSFTSLINNESFSYSHSFFFILVCWLPYLLILYPATVSPDTVNQLFEFFGHGKDVWDIYPIGHYLLNGHVFSITNMHNFFITLFFGICAKLGLILFHNINAGLFIAAVVQILVSASVLTYTLKFFADYGFSKKITNRVKYIYAFFPLFPIYNIFLTKNALYSSFVVLCVTLLCQALLRPDVIRSKSWQILMFVSSLGQLISSKYGIYVLVVTLLVTLLGLRKYWLQLLTTILLPLIIFEVGVNGILFSTLNVSKGDPIEGYGVPIQQTALCVKDNPHEISKHDYRVLNKVFVVKNMASQYQPTAGDPIKSSGPKKGVRSVTVYRYKTVTRKDMQQYKKVWLHMMGQHPVTYFEAFTMVNYGYFDVNQNSLYSLPDVSTDYLPLGAQPAAIPASESGNKVIHHPNVTNSLRLLLSFLGNTFVKMPPINVFLKGAFYVWATVILFLFVFAYINPRYLIPLIPLVMQIFVCAVSEISGNQRYLYPLIYGIIVAVGYVGLALRYYHEKKQ